MRLFRSLLVAGIVTGFAGSAQALPITDVIQPDPPVTLNTNVPHFYTHDLLTHGFDPLVDTLTSATLTLDITGQNGQPLTIRFEGDQVFSSSLGSLGPLTVALNYLQTDGLLNVSLTKGGGAGNTFSFVRSTLFVDGEVSDPGGPGNNIPEPATLALLGIGLLGGAARLRRSRTA